MISDPLQLLLLEKDTPDADFIRQALTRRQRPNATRFEVTGMSSIAKAIHWLSGNACHAILMDLGLDDSQGLEGLQRIVEAAPELPVVILTGLESETLGEQAIRHGAQDYLVKSQVSGELVAKALVHAVERKRQEQNLLQLAHSLRDANERLRAISQTDVVTGLANRRQFDEVLKLEWRRARRFKTPIGLILVDVDHFKLFNDTYGHPAGDRCLESIGSILRTTCRRASDLPARFGGDEFGVIVPGMDSAQAHALGRKIRKRVEAQTIPHENSPIAPRVTVSVGVASMSPVIGKDPADLLETADKSLYQVKHGGRNHVIVAAEEDAT